MGEAKKHKLRDAEVTQVGRYQLAFELASGGMATVYLARTQGPAGFDKVVALKRIHPHLAKEGQFIDMFLDEARIASRISHPNVCSVFDFGEAEGSYFIAMEYVMGETVSRLIRRLRRNEDSYKDLPLKRQRLGRQITPAMTSRASMSRLVSPSTSRLKLRSGVGLRMTPPPTVCST
ncbi:MAG: protein kinase [Deltaproteobacteria bacterium]|nr:protein kinase [Deltaproteobacteria bacterium]